MDRDSKGQRTLGGSGGGLRPAVEGHSLDYNSNEWIRVSVHNFLSRSVPEIHSTCC